MATSNSPESVKYKILIVDDHPIVCRGLRQMIADEPDLEVCGEAADAAEAMRQIEATCPDVAIVDLALRSGHGLDLIQEIRARGDDVKVLVSSMHDESLFAERAVRAGALGYINKQEALDKIIEAVRQVLRGDIYLSPHVATRLLKSVTGREVAAETPLATLSDRELEVFEMIGRGLSTKKIASMLSLSIKTIETHRERIKSKLDLKNSNELSRQATLWVLETGARQQTEGEQG